MHSNAELIEKFYRAFQRRDGATMASCYHRQVQFSDPVFTGATAAKSLEDYIAKRKGVSRP